MLGLQPTDISRLVMISGVVTRAEERQVSMLAHMSQLQLQLCVPDNCKVLHGYAPAWCHSFVHC